jgi:hypothetical protein
VNKFLGLLVLALACTLTFGTLGCNPAKDEKDKKKDKEAEAKAEGKKDKKDKKDKDEAKDEISFKEIKGEQKIGKKVADKEITIEVTKAPKEDMPLTVTVKSGDKVAEKITGKGSIGKDKTEGKLMISTDEAVAGEYMVEVTADKLKTSFKLIVEK